MGQRWQNMNRSNSRGRERGGAIIGVLFFILIISILLLGAATLAAGHQQRCQYDANYAAAVDLAEAGVNYEFRKLSQNVGQADTAPFTVNAPFGGAGTSFTVQCYNRGTTTPWSGPGTNLEVVSTGTINGVWRRVRVSSKAYSTPANYALFGVNQGLINGTAAEVDGDVGTDGFFTFNGHPTIGGQVVFNGPNSNWQSPPNGSYNVTHNADPVPWPTVDSLANAAFPGGSLTWLSGSSNNDNALAVPPIVANKVLVNGNGTITFKGKAGGANYYITSLTMNGNAKVVFDNTNGPINIWEGPSGVAGTFVFNGGSAAVKASSDPTKDVRVYVASTNDVILNGNTELDAGVYNYNGATSGRVIFNGTPDVYGSVISNMFTLNGNPTIHYMPGYFTANVAGYYGYDNAWKEEQPR